MDVKITISPNAQEELDELECRFKAKAGSSSFIDDFKNQLKILSKIPGGFQIRYRDVRIIHFDEFDYSIHYVLKMNVVYILRILHQRKEY